MGRAGRAAIAVPDVLEDSDSAYRWMFQFYDVLESTSPDAIPDVGRNVEQHMPSAQPGMIMRRHMIDLLHSQGEEDVTREYA